MKPGQNKIYFLTADSLSAARSSPHLEVFRTYGVEVLLLTDRIDEWVVSHLTQFDGKALQSAAAADLDLSDLGEAATGAGFAKRADDAKALVEAIKSVLADAVKDVRVSGRLSESPACLTSDAHDLSPRLARMLRDAGQAAPTVKPVLEIDPGHPLLRHMERQIGTPGFDDLARYLVDQAILAEGGVLDDPAGFVRRTNALILDDGLAPSPSEVSDIPQADDPGKDTPLSVS
jgi:molecular chaperone HtpG